jgi:hypothetical protein
MAQVTPLLTLHSSTSNRSLRIEAATNSYLSAVLESHVLSGSVEVWAETGDVAGLAQFFGELGALDAPWSGSRTWVSIESDLELSATCTSLGAVTFKIGMRGLPGAPEEWRLEAGLETEFGQLARLATEAKGLLSAQSAT